MAWTVAAGAAALAVAAGLADSARNRRKNLDRVSLMPWQLISVLAFFAAVGLAAAAARM